ncbi:MAG: DnaB-like helicase C-terminal domain-containing protein, partial [Armatimonadetes bacterium]|nr:DnaB-like helicase C-terminal domain-containing protein [Armatimonadota bacterium]
FREDYYERKKKPVTSEPAFEGFVEDEKKPEFFVTEGIIAKNRNGPVTTVEVAFVPRYALFENLSSVHTDLL